MRIAARFLIAVLIVLVLAGIALFFLRKPIVAAAAERILKGVGLEAPEVAVDEVSLTRLDVARLEAGGGAERGLDLRDVALFYDWRALLFDGKIRSIEISGGRVVAAFDDAGGMNIAGWSPDPNVKPAPPPFKTLKVGALDVIARTPKGDARLDTAGAFDYADGGEFRIGLASEGAGFATAAMSGASGEATLRFGADGSIAAKGAVTGDVTTPAGAVRGLDAELDAALSSWRGFFGAAPRALEGEATLLLKSSTLDAAATPSLAPVADAGGAPIRSLSLSGGVKAAFAEGGFSVSIAGGPVTIAADRGDRLVIEAGEGPLYESRAGAKRLSLKAALEGPAATGVARLSAASENEGPWEVDAAAALGEQTVGGVSLGSFDGAFAGAYAAGRLSGVADIKTLIKSAAIGRLRINDMPAAARLDVVADLKAKSMSASAADGACLVVDRAAFRMIEQDMDARISDASLCPGEAPLVAVVLADPATARVSGRLAARTAHYRLGKTVFDGAPPEIDFSLDYDPAAQTSRIAGKFSGGRVILNDAFALSGARGTFDGAIVGEKMNAKAALETMRIAQNAALEVVAPVLVSGEAGLADDVARFDIAVMTPKGQPLGKGEGGHEVRTGRGEAIFDSGILTFKYGLQPDGIIPALRGVISSATGTTEGRARFAWAPNELGSSATVNLDDVSFAGPGVAVTRTEGVAGKIVFSNLSPVATAGEQTLSIRKIDLDALKLENGGMRFEMPGDETLRVAEAEFPWFSGVIGVYDAAINIGGGTAQTSLQIDDVDLGQLLKYPNVEGLSGEGKIEGVLPIVFEGGRAFIRSGVLSAKGGGLIRYENKNAEPAFQANEQTRLAYEVLKEVRFRNLSLVIDGPLDGELNFKIVFDGEGAIPVKTRAGSTRVLSPIIYRLTMNVPLLKLAQGAKAAVDPVGFLKSAPRSPDETEKAVEDLIGSNPDIF
ncbi:MAG: YdbH domain-containing protein [Parvularculaceae bacterium]|nr:YdbH domain-containing protein [Parvularculaceae bacterium]